MSSDKENVNPNTTINSTQETIISNTNESLTETIVISDGSIHNFFEDDYQSNSDLDDYLTDNDELEKNMATTDVENYMADLKEHCETFEIIQMAIRKRKRVIKSRNRNSNENLNYLFENDFILKRFYSQLEMLKILFIYKIEHLNDALLFNLIFHEKYNCSLILNNKPTQDRFRHRITNFLSRVRARNYNVERIYHWVELMRGSFRVLMLGLVTENDRYINVN